MRRKKFFKLIIASFFLLYFLFFFNKKITLAADAYITGCLKIVNTYKPTCVTDKYPCLDLPSDVNINIFGGKTDHIAKIEGGGFPVGKPIYIVGCVSTPSGIKCTTGDSTLNTQVNQTGFSVTNDIPGYEFKAVNNPITSENGTVSVIVRSYIPTAMDHLFFGIVEVTQAEYQGEAKTITYGTFGFSDDPQKCISINWDPKGRVFDSVSLEPLPGVEITLLDNKKNAVVMPGVKNPIITSDDGVFNFFVPSGIYYLDPKKNNYQFPLNLSDVNKNYSQAYYCDKKVGSSLYTSQLPINEENELIHCDVPLKPKANPYQSEPKLMNYGYMVLGKSTKFFGRFSHPLVLINLKQENKLLTTTKADKFGSWDITIDNDKISSLGGEIEIEAFKNPNFYPITTASPSSNNIFEKKIGLLNILKKIYLSIFKQVFSQSISTKVIFHPILRYIEGHAYNNQKELIPNAIVRVVVEMNGHIYHETKADSNGFFVIFPNNLPIFPYYLEIIDPKKPNIKNTQTTSSFIKFNKTYLEKNNINLITALKNNQPVSTEGSQLQKKLTVTPVEDKNFLIPTQSNVTTNKATSLSQPQPKNMFLIIVGILIFLVILVTGLIFYYINKNKTPTSLN